MNKNIEFFAHLIAKVIVGAALLVFGIDLLFSTSRAHQIFGLILVCIGLYHIFTANALFKKEDK